MSSSQRVRTRTRVYQKHASSSPPETRLLLLAVVLVMHQPWTGRDGSSGFIRVAEGKVAVPRSEQGNPFTSCVLGKYSSKYMCPWSSVMNDTSLAPLVSALALDSKPLCDTLRSGTTHMVGRPRGWRVASLW